MGRDRWVELEGEMGVYGQKVQGENDNGVETLQVKRDQNKVGWLGE